MASMTGLAAGLCNLNALTTDFKKLSTFSPGHLTLNANVVSKPLVYSSAHQRSRNNCRTLRVYSLSGEKTAKKKGVKNSSKAGIRGNNRILYKTMKKAHNDTRLEEVQMLVELAKKEFDGYCEGGLVKATLSGDKKPAHIEITEAAIELGPEKLSLLVNEAYKDALQKIYKVINEKMSDIESRRPPILVEIAKFNESLANPGVASPQIVED